MSLVARTPVLQRQILRSRAFVPSRGAHSGYKVCVHAKKTNDGALVASPSVRAFLAHAFQLRGLESRLWRQSRHLPSFRVFRPIPRLLLPDVCQRFGSLILLSDLHSQLLQ